jgi:hypothetical protein
MEPRKNIRAQLQETISSSSLPPNEQIAAVKLLIEAKADPTTALYYAADTGNVAVVQDLIQSGVPVDSLLKEHEEARLEDDISNPSPEYIEECGAKRGIEQVKEYAKARLEYIVEERTKGIGQTALLVATNQGHLNVINTLLELKANPNLRNRDAQNALINALSSSASNDQPEDSIIGVTQSLLDAKAEVMYTLTKTTTTYTKLEINEETGMKELYEFKDVKIGNTDVWGPDPIPTGTPIPTPIISDEPGPSYNALGFIRGGYILVGFASAHPQVGVKLTQLLLDAKCDPNVRSASRGYSVLENLVNQDYLEAAKILIEHKAVIEPDDRALHTVIRSLTKDAKNAEQRLALVDLLLDHGANATGALLSFQYHVSHPYPALFQKLLKLEINLNHENETHRGKTALFSAIETRDKIAIRHLLDRKADVNVKYRVRSRANEWKTPLLAAFDNFGVDPEIITLLVENKADINARCEKWPEPAYSALSTKNETIVRAICGAEQLEIDQSTIDNLFVFVGKLINTSMYDNHQALFVIAMNLLLPKAANKEMKAEYTSPQGTKFSLLDYAWSCTISNSTNSLISCTDKVMQTKSLFVLDVLLKLDVSTINCTNACALYLMNCNYADPLLTNCLTTFFSQQQRFRAQPDFPQDVRRLRDDLYTLLETLVSCLVCVEDLITKPIKEAVSTHLSPDLTMDCIKRVLEFIAPLHDMPETISLQDLWTRFQGFPEDIRPRISPEFAASGQLSQDYYLPRRR